jgi:chloramphenicol 3-O-phosphotransferase
MSDPGESGQVVILNGAPRSGKSSIASNIQETFDGTWMNLGVDVARLMTPHTRSRASDSDQARPTTRPRRWCPCFTQRSTSRSRLTADSG